MTRDTARLTAGPLFKVPAHAMAAAQLTAPEEFGVDSMSFYVQARSAVLGEAEPGVVAAAFVWLQPDLIRRALAEARAVISTEVAESHWRAAMHRWAIEHLSDLPDMTRLADVLRRCVVQADGAQAPIFSGWRALDTPLDPAAEVLHHMYALRELRSSLHACAVLAQAISPREAVAIRTPWLLEVFGWSSEPSPSLVVPRWEAAERATDLMMERVFEGLDSGESADLIEGLERVLAHTGSLWSDDPSSPATVPQQPTAPS